MKMNRIQRLLSSAVMILGLLSMGQNAIAQGKGHGGGGGQGHQRPAHLPIAANGREAVAKLAEKVMDCVLSCWIRKCSTRLCTTTPKKIGARSSRRPHPDVPG
jgi:hypothetical protein